MEKLQDKFNRTADYLRISVTDRCNLRCRYCMPENGVAPVCHDDILRFEEIERIVRVAAGMGVKKVRITGGEPLVRKGVAGLIGAIHAIKGIDDIALTTNGVLLAGLAETLKQAGLNRVNISLDSLDAEKYACITRRGRLEDCLNGIKAAWSAGLQPIKLNVVVTRGSNDDEIIAFAEFAIKHELGVRFIELMPTSAGVGWNPEGLVSADDIKSVIEGKYVLVPDTVPGNGPSANFRIRGTNGRVGFITALSAPFCASCNRLRLTAAGMLRGCLHQKREINIKDALRNGASDTVLGSCFRTAIRNKEARHFLTGGGDCSASGLIMSGVGG